MINEYAIEPALAVAWAKNQSEFEYYYEKFGLGRSKIMSEFPKFKNWRKQFKRPGHKILNYSELRHFLIS